MQYLARNMMIKKRWQFRWFGFSIFKDDRKARRIRGNTKKSMASVCQRDWSRWKGARVVFKNRAASKGPCQRCVRYTGSSFTERQIGRRHVGSLVDHPGSGEIVAPDARWNKSSPSRTFFFFLIFECFLSLFSVNDRRTRTATSAGR